METWVSFYFINSHPIIHNHEGMWWIAAVPQKPVFSGGVNNSSMITKCDHSDAVWSREYKASCDQL